MFRISLLLTTFLVVFVVYILLYIRFSPIVKGRKNITFGTWFYYLSSNRNMIYKDDLVIKLGKIRLTIVWHKLESAFKSKSWAITISHNNKIIFVK